MTTIQTAAPAGAQSAGRTVDPFDVIGRLAVATLFLDAARYHLTSAGWGRTLADMAARGVPMPAPVLLAAMAASILLALALLLNIRARWAALGLAVYTIGVSSIMYTPFVGLGQASLILFLKDLCIFGALLSLSRRLPDTGWRPTLSAGR